MSSEKVLTFRLITLMNTLISNCRSIKSGLLVYESDPLTEEETEGNRNREKEDTAMQKHPWNQMNLTKVKTVSHIQKNMEERKAHFCLWYEYELIQRNSLKKTTTKWKKRQGWCLSSEASNSGSHCDASVSEENKRGWEKWASRCDSLFLRPPWHHLLTAGMCSIIFINIG